MCGIAGIIDFKRVPPLETLSAMIGRMRHRGPDGAGIYQHGPAGLAHARLSIIDMETGGQPIQNEDGTVWVVFNGEIYNYIELRNELTEEGHRFYTRTDTEVLVHLYETHGTGMLSRLNGQFAFALWDRQNERLMMGRDRVGIRPLFYCHKPDCLVFGSEAKAVFADDRVSRQMDIETLSDIFTCWTPLAGATPFSEVRQIPPGHFALFSRKGLNLHPYWRFAFDEHAWHKDRQPSDMTAWVEELEALLGDAIRIRLRADVPVAAYLSGGIDSTLISAWVKRRYNQSLQTFSVTFTDGRFDESSFQSRAVGFLGTEHRRIPCDETDIGEVFPDVIWHCETPLFRTAPAPLFMLSGLVRKHGIKVVLTGEGADELFAGYNIFKEDKIRRFWARRPESKMRATLLARLYPYVFSGENEKARAFAGQFFRKNLTRTGSPAYSHLIRWQNTGHLRGFFRQSIREKMENLDGFIEKYAATLPPGFMSWHPLSKAQYTESTIFLCNYLLSSQGDRMAMAHSVEGRFPYLDHRIIEFAGRVPPSFRLWGLTEKRILKEAAKKLLPRDLACRPKQPYRAPIARCFFGEKTPEYVDDLLSETSLRQAGYFDPGRVASLVRKCRNRAGRLLSERENMAIVGILSTQILHNQFVQNFPACPARNGVEIRCFG